jgi:hypothetical protein
MPGYAEYLEVESAAKVLANLLPADVDDKSSATWQQLYDMAEKLDQNVDALVTATAGRSQEPKARDLKEITAQLVRAISRIIDGTAEDASIATTRGAIRSLPDVFAGFDQERLQRT